MPTPMRHCATIALDTGLLGKFPCNCRFVEDSTLNYLAHLFLAGNEPFDVVGNLMGDFVRGPVDERFDDRFHHGIRLHRKIDAFTDSHPAFARSRRLLTPRFRRFSGVIMDVYYDHLLARDWSIFSEEPLEQFAHRTYGILSDHYDLMPAPMQRKVSRMITSNWLVAYRDPATTRPALTAIGKRFRRPVELAPAATELERSSQAIAEDFHEFLPDIQSFVAGHKAK